MAFCHVKPEKTSGFECQVLFGYQCSGRVWVAKRSDCSPSFGYPNPSLNTGPIIVYLMKADLRQDIIGGFAFRGCLVKGTFP